MKDQQIQSIRKWEENSRNFRAYPAKEMEDSWPWDLKNVHDQHQNQFILDEKV